MARVITLRASAPPVLDPSIIEQIDAVSTPTESGGWIVTVFNNQKNTWEEVIEILRAATHCTFEEAWSETWEIDNLGMSVVHQAGEDECREVAKTIATIGIKVEVTEA